MLRREPGQWLLADRTPGRGAIGFGLRGPLGGLAQQFLDVVRGLALEVAEILIAGQDQALDGLFQGAGRARRQHTQRL